LATMQHVQVAALQRVTTSYLRHRLKTLIRRS